MPRPARPDDLYRLSVPMDPRLSPDGRLVAFTVKATAPGKDAYRQAVWLAPVDGGADPRRVTIGARTDLHARFSPDGRTLAFLSDRRVLVEEEPDRPTDAKEREDCNQVHLLPLDGGEARRLTDLPRGVNEFAWRLVSEPQSTPGPPGRAVQLARKATERAPRTSARSSRGASSRASRS